MGRGDSSADPSKDEFADAVPAAPVNFDPSQVGLSTQPVDAADTAFPASHYRATLLVRTRNSPLRLASVTEGLPLLRSNTSQKCRVNGIEDIQICNYSPRDGGTRTGALNLLI